MKPGDTRIPDGYVVERIAQEIPGKEQPPEEEKPLNLTVLRIDYPAASNPPKGIQNLATKPSATPAETPEPKKKKKTQ